MDKEIQSFQFVFTGQQYNFIVENQSITINITMITKDKITEIFCIADDFCKEFELETDKIGLSEKNKGCQRHRRWRMSKSD